MAWQRLLCVGFCAVALSSAACRAQGDESSPTALAAKKHVAKSNTAKSHQPVKSRATAAKARLRAVAAAKPAKPVRSRERKPGQVGYASWYGGERNGMSMASGGRFNENDLTAAHRTLPLDSRARVTNMVNGRSVTVRITDRGPSRQGRIIDLSQSAADELGMRNTGVTRVHVEPFVPPNLP
jgi:rare lipoprotein A